MYCTHCVVTVAAVLGYNPLDSSTWSRWDSGLYEDIARDGYALLPCEEEPQKWCGDAGWFPLYSWVVGVLHQLGLPLRGTAVVVSWLFAGATIVLLWATFLERRTGAAAAAALFYAAFSPGQIYHYAVFPLSLLAFATVACLWLLYRERAVAAGVAGAVAALSYPAGVLLVPVCVVWLVTQTSHPLGERLRRAR
jgi:Gpi18-like mannosyltransferase